MSVYFYNIMERIIKLLQHIAASSRINGDSDIEFIANVIIGSIERDCVDELADKLREFTTSKVHEIIFINQVKQMINESKN